MRQEIHFKGLSLTPDNRHAELGALSMCAGVELHDGALRPSVMPHTQISSKLPVPKSPSGFYEEDTATLRFVHQGNGYTHFIGTFIASNLAKDDVYWYDEAGDDFGHFYGGKLTGISASTITDIQAIGNTLIFICTTGIYYVLWKDGGYKTLGEKPPFVKIQFSLDEYEYTGDPLQEMSTAPGDMYDLANQQNLVVDIKDEYQTEFTENAYALINRVHAEITEAGAFYAPFFIRYCYRLFDGTSFVLHSPPVLMPVCIGHEDYLRIRGLQPVDWGQPTMRIDIASGDKRLQIAPMAAKLQYKCNSPAEWDSLTSFWSDIVSSVDVFISPPITRTRQGEHFTKVGVLTDESWRLYDGTQYIIPRSNYVHAFNPELDKDAYKDKLFTPDVFFKITSFSLKDEMETSEFVDLPVSGTVLSALAAQTRMKDDYHTHHYLQADGASNSHSYVYNKRLHVFSAKEKLFEGFQEDTLLPFFDAGGEEIDRIYVHLSTEDGEKIVYAQGSLLSNFRNGLPIFYPDSRAYQMVIVTKATSTQASVTYTFPMAKLPLLEGAVTQGNYTTGGNIPQALDSIVPTPNKIYVSEVANPFFFPLEARVTVGIGSVIGVAAVTLALSPGQFGKFPLIVFCTDGIWTLDVSSTGTYSAANLISDEVCSNAQSICQLDQSVLFATSRGLSRIVESQVVSVSDALDGPLFDVNSKLGYSDGVNEPLVSVIDSGVKSLRAFSTHPYEFFKEGMLMYDFANSRVIVVKTGQNAAYVLSLKDGTWSTMSIGNVIAVVNGYPYPYCQQKYTVQENNVVVEYGPVWHLDQGYSYATQDAPTNYALVVTRSISFAATMQVIQAFQQIHDCEDNSRTPLLFIHGSNNDVTWKQIGYVQRSHAPYLPGHPYRFFRISIYLQMKTWEKYSSLILDVIEKYEKL